MNYKTYCKNHETVSIRIRIIGHRVRDGTDICEIAHHYSMHRNSVTNIMHLYEAGASPEFREKISSWTHLSQKEIETLWMFLLPLSRKPHSHPKQANLAEEAKTLSDFKQVKVGAKKLVMMLGRKKELWNLTIGRVKWIYKRNNLRVQKVRTKNGETRSLYNYRAIGAFEDMHYDTKVLADAKSLPEEIYDNFKNNEHLPLYEWNIIDVASRSRFIAYSRGKSSTFWLQFLVYTLSHLRYHGISRHIRVHTDGGVEFFSGSERKQWEWNTILAELDADIDCYNPNWDIRKNLIERSHRSDDEEFLIPFGASMKTRKQFMVQSQEYSDYWNTLRSHSGKGMEGRTPEEKLRALWIHNAWNILTFKVLHLDETFTLLQEHLEYFQFQLLLKSVPKERFISERKIWLDLLTRYPHMKSYAQNVLTYYQKSSVRYTYIIGIISYLSPISLDYTVPPDPK